MPLSIKPSKTDTIIAFTVTVNLTQQMRNESLAPLGKGTAAEAETSSASFNDAVAVDEVYHTDALSHLHK